VVRDFYLGSVTVASFRDRPHSLMHMIDGFGEFGMDGDA
jgi:hypothetical protein